MTKFTLKYNYLYQNNIALNVNSNTYINLLT